MGHISGSMAEEYRDRIDDEQAIAEKLSGEIVGTVFDTLAEGDRRRGAVRLVPAARVGAELAYRSFRYLFRASSARSLPINESAFDHIGGNSALVCTYITMYVYTRKRDCKDRK